jgi:hypothetical protein
LAADRIIQLYRIGKAYALTPTAPDAEEVTLVVRPEVVLKRSGMGELLVYWQGKGFGVSVEDAVNLGWCRILD